MRGNYENNFLLARMPLAACPWVAWFQVLFQPSYGCGPLRSWGELKRFFGFMASSERLEEGGEA